MRIIFGTGSFKLLHKKPSELGLPSDLDVHMTIEKRQQYFHLFWIPFFSLGQTWVMLKNGDKNRYEVPNDIKRHLNAAYPKHKTPWYTFFLTIVIGLGLTVLATIGVYNAIRKNIARKSSNEYFTKMQYNEINKGLPNTYVALRNNNAFKVTLKVLSTDKTHLRCAVSNRQSDDGNFSEYPNAFLPDSNGVTDIDTLLISKAELLDAYNYDFFKPIKKPITIGKIKDLRMDGSFYLDMPLFEISNFEIQDGLFRATLKNTHVESTILNIIPSTQNKNNIILEPIKAKTLQIGDTINLKGKVKDERPSFSGKIEYKTKYNHQDSLDINIYRELVEISFYPPVYRE